MTDSRKFPRKRFLKGAGVTVIGAAAIATDSTMVAAAEGQRQPPRGFSYAPGKAPEIMPTKDVYGFIDSVDDRQIVVRSGSSVEVAPLDAKPFIWKDGPVQPRHAALRLTVGDPVTISGVTDQGGHYLDVQHVWVGLIPHVDM